MIFITWDNEADAVASLQAINESIFNCPIVDPIANYNMISWSVLSKAQTEERWGFVKPPDHDIDHLLVVPYSQTNGYPSGWFVMPEL